MGNICRVRPRITNCKKKEDFLVGRTGLVNS